MGFGRVWAVIRWPVAIVLLAGGLYSLFGFWATFNRFVDTRSLVYPPGWHAELAFWYGFPWFQAGLLLGLGVGLAGRRVGRLLVILNVAVWSELAVNIAIVLSLFRTGAMF